MLRGDVPVLAEAGLGEGRDALVRLADVAADVGCDALLGGRDLLVGDEQVVEAERDAVDSLHGVEDGGIAALADIRQQFGCNGLGLRVEGGAAEEGLDFGNGLLAGPEVDGDVHVALLRA